MGVFDEFALAYDNTIDWDSRLKRELPFIISSISKKGDVRVLDIACGSGRHAIALAEEGMTVHGFDNSQSMITTAESLANELEIEIDFRVGDMQEVSQMYDEQFNLIICLGNSLALLPTMKKFSQMLESIYQMLTEEGILIFQTLNFEAVEEQGIRFMPSKTGLLPSGEEVTFSRFLDYTQGDPERASLVLSYLVESLDSKPIVQTQEVLRITYPRVEQSLLEAGFKTYEVFSDYAKTPFQREFDRNIIVCAMK